MATGLEHAKAELQIAIEVAENNAPISEAEGQLAQALLQRQTAEQCKYALELLDRDLAELEGEMMDKNSPYWKDPKRQELYRNLIEKRTSFQS